MEEQDCGLPFRVSYTGDGSDEVGRVGLLYDAHAAATAILRLVLGGSTLDASVERIARGDVTTAVVWKVLHSACVLTAPVLVYWLLRYACSPLHLGLFAHSMLRVTPLRFVPIPADPCAMRTCTL